MADSRSSRFTPFEEARQTSENRLLRSILLWAAFGSVAVGLCAGLVPTALFFDRLELALNDLLSGKGEA